ncbi:MAG: hypothetical protein H6721_19890 [Sandaracinus sp.]|nr:hypothetical protein [Sandaracinus sp.]MCB9634392.1 hypothetical protein [Sandaracinus sp.]
MRSLALLLTLAACGSDSEICDADALARALDEASPGDVVRVGDCAIEGAFVVPEGVVLEGTADGSELSGEVVVDLAADATLRSLRVRSRELGVVVRGAGTRTLESLELVPTRGAGVASTDATLVARSLVVRGPVVDPDDPAWVRVAGFRPTGPCPADGVCECEPGALRDDEVCDESGAWARFTAVYGIYARRSTLTLDDVTVSGFATAGAVLDGSTTAWTNGEVAGNLGLGVLVRGGAAELEALRITDTAEGLRGLASYALASTDATLDGTALSLRNNDRYGVLVRGGEGTLVDFVAEDQGDVALWLSGTTRFTVEGDSRIERAAFAGVVASEADDVTLDNLRVAGTRSITRTLGSLFGAQTIGDGIHLSATPNATLRGVTLEGHARVGLMVDLAGGTPRFENVSVDATAEGFGAVGGTRAAGDLTSDGPGTWDVGIVRSELAATRDAAALGERFDAVGLPLPAGANESVGIVFPMF